MEAQSLLLTKKGEFREKIRNNYKKNYIVFFLLLQKIPLELKEKIEAFRKRHNKIRKKDYKQALDTPFSTNEKLFLEFYSLIESLCFTLNLDIEQYANSFMKYIFYKKIEPPFMNFYITEDIEKISIHRTHAYTEEDTYLENIFINARYKNKPLRQTKNYRITLHDTLLRKFDSSQFDSTFDAMDSQYGVLPMKDGKIPEHPNDKQKKGLIRQDKHRLKKLTDEFY